MFDKEEAIIVHKSNRRTGGKGIKKDPFSRKGKNNESS